MEEQVKTNDRIRTGRMVFIDCVNRRQKYLNIKKCKDELKEFLINYKRNELHSKYCYSDNYNKSNKKNIIDFELISYKKIQLDIDLNKIITEKKRLF
jgi:hypothetical protein